MSNKDKEIVITIRIPDYEYQTWDEYDKGGPEACARECVADLRQRMKQDYVYAFDIKSEVKDKD